MDSARRTGLLLGWLILGVKRGEIAKTLLKNEFYKVVELRNSEKVAVLNGFPSLGAEEALLLSEVLEKFKESGSESVESFFGEYCVDNGIVVDNEQKNYLCKLARLCAFGFGPLSVLLECDSIEEIAVVGTGREKPVRIFEKSFGYWLNTNFCYCSREAVKNLVNRMSKTIGRRITMQNPRLNAVLPDGSRLTSSIEPVSFSGPSVTIRKFRKAPFSPLELALNKTLNFEALGLLWLAMRSECSVLIAGNTGSGKTTLLNALFCFVPKNERIVVVEETPELNILHKHLVKLSVVDGLNVKMMDLITDSLRMRPDRVVVGEVRSREEVGAFVDTMLAGQGKGSYATFHAQNSRDAVNRLGRLGVLETDLDAIDLVVVLKRWTVEKRKRLVEKRRVLEIAETTRTGRGVEINPLLKFNYQKDGLEWVGKSKKLVEKASRLFERKANLKKMACAKAKEFKKLSAKNPGALEVFRLVGG